jgi:predicted phage tail protein
MSKKINREKSKGFSGSFGGAKNAASRTQTPVSGRSTSTAYILGALCEGEIEGSIGGVKGVYLDEVPIQNANDSYNFKDYEFHFRPGSQIQNVIDFNTGQRDFAPTATGLPNYNDVPQIFTYNNPDIAITRLFFEVILEAFVPSSSFYIIVGNANRLVFPGIKFRLSYTFNQDDSGWTPYYEEVVGGNDFASSINVTSVEVGVTSDGGSITAIAYYLTSSSTKRTPEISFSTPKTFVKIKIEKLSLGGEIRGIETFRGTAYDYGYPLYDYYLYQPLPLIEDGYNAEIIALNNLSNGKHFQVNLNLNKYWGTSVGFNKQVSLETPVQVAVKNNLEITRQFTSETVKSIKVKLAFTLQRFDDQGNTYGERVNFRIDVNERGNGFVNKVNSFFEGRYPSPTEVDFLIPVSTAPNSNNNTFQIRVYKDTPEANNPNTQQEITWVSYTQVTFTTLNYPNTAIAGFKFNTEYFQQIPSVAIKLAGRIIQIPSNATIHTYNSLGQSNNPQTRYLTFNGNWNGNFIPGKNEDQEPTACSDPAWILYDLLTNTRYGLGNYIDTSQIDKWGLYEISKYCNELVSDGSGKSEPRFSCNVKLEGKVEAYQVIQNLVSIFRGFAYWQAGVVSFAADASGSVVHQFTQADIEEGSFTYSRSGLKSRKTVAVVSYLNPLDFYKKAVEVVEDPIGIAKWGVRELEIDAIACSSRGQARRAGVAALLTNRMEQESVTFKARAFAAYVKPGDLIRIYDSKRTAARYAGIIKSATATSVTLDSPVDLATGTTYKITVTTSKLVPPVPNGVDAAVLENDPVQEQKLRFEVKEATITSTGNNLTVLNLQSPGFGADVPPPESNWIIQGGTLSNTIYRVINRSPVQDSIEGMHEILAVEYNSSKYSLIDGMSLL